MNWTCQCQAVNTDRYCEFCGTERPSGPAKGVPRAASPKPAPPTTAREEVADLSPEERKELMAKLQGHLATMDARHATLRPSRRKWNGESTEAVGDPENSAHLPHDRGSVEDLAWRQMRAAQALASLAEYCERNGIDWNTGRSRPVRRHEEVATS